MPSPSLYADLSCYYNLLCSSIDYQEQSQFALRAHQLFGQGGNAYLDLGCGSGPHLAELFVAGYICSGLDLSEHMLALAAQRVPQATLYCQNMSKMNVPAQFDLITCFLYSIHYCYPHVQLQQTLHNAFRALNVGGLFCFDAVDKNSISNDAGHTHHVTHNKSELTFQSRWQYSGEGDQLDLHIAIAETVGENIKHYSEAHCMSAITIHELIQLAEKAGFEVTVLERDFIALKPWDKVQGNVLFCCVKK